MTPVSQRIAIAKVCGWANVKPFDSSYEIVSPWGVHEKEGPAPIPDYLNDLNAMHEAEEVAEFYYYPRRERYCAVLQTITNNDRERPIWCATAAQRAEAFLRTLNLWDDSK